MISQYSVHCCGDFTTQRNNLLVIVVIVMLKIKCQAYCAIVRVKIPMRYLLLKGVNIFLPFKVYIFRTPIFRREPPLRNIDT